MQDLGEPKNRDVKTEEQLYWVRPKCHQPSVLSLTVTLSVSGKKKKGKHLELLFPILGNILLASSQF